MRNPAIYGVAAQSLRCISHRADTQVLPYAAVNSRSFFVRLEERMGGQAGL